MNDYYCKNCNYLVGKWNDIFYFYDGSNFCYSIRSKNNKFTYFLNCEKCDKFVGMECLYVCKNCFGENEIFGEENLFNWFLKYKKFKLKYRNFKYSCKICNNRNFRCQFWFFKELTFYK